MSGIEVLLVNKQALRAIRAGELEPILSQAAGIVAHETDFAPGLWEVMSDKETVDKLRALARKIGETVSRTIEQLAHDSELRKALNEGEWQG